MDKPFEGEGRASLSEYWVAFKAPLLAILSGTGWYVGIVSAFDFGGDELNSKLLIAGIIVGIALILISAIVAFVQTRKRCVSQTVRLQKSASVIIHSEGYVTALKQTCKRLAEKGKPLDGLICVCGVSNLGTLDYVSEGSALEALLELIAYDELGEGSRNRGFLKSSSFAQMNAMAKERVDELVRNGQTMISENGTPRIRYGQCIVIDLPYKADASPPSVGHPKLMLVANSSCDKLADIKADAMSGTGALEGPSSVDVIPFVFEELKGRHITTLIMPAMGTYRLGNTYQTVISEIVSRYLASLQSTNETYNLVLSLHERDLQRSKVGLMQVRRYVRNAIALFSH
ncbi:MAG: hypothetical protein IJH04_06265 [Eggerthellaceae bacterium]|nr:hypothetical protein [Eggerthellaceae bacterium]